MSDAEFRTLLHDRLGPALDELAAPDLLSGVRARQVRHQRSVRAGLASASVLGVAAVVVAVAVWPSASSAGPVAPAATVSASVALTPAVSAVPSAAVSASAAPASAVPSPSTAIVNLAGLAPLVASGPCAGLTVAAFVESRDIHPAVTAVTPAGAAFTMGDGQILDLKTKGPCVDRLSFVQRTPTFQNNIDVPYSFVEGEGGVVTQGSATNQTGVVQLFLDCKGLVCSGSGAPLATLTVRVRGTGLGSASQPFTAAPTPLPVPTGAVLTVPSVIGMSLEEAQNVVSAAGFEGFAAGSSGSGAPGLVLSQDPPVGSVVPQGSTIQVMVSGGLPHPSGAAIPSGSVREFQAAIPSLPPPATAPMPDVVGLTVAHADEVLAKANIVYSVTYQSGPEPRGIVIAQSPVAGAIVGAHSRIELTVAGAKP